MTFIIMTIVLHWLCDFVLQVGDLSDDRESDYKLKHCLYYAFTFPASFWVLWLLTDASIECYLWFVAVNIIQHTIVDYLLIPVLYYYKERHRIQSLAVYWALDQVVHVSFILYALSIFIL